MAKAKRVAQSPEGTSYLAPVTTARIASVARAHEVLVSGTVRDLVARFGFAFVDCVAH